MWYGTDGMQKGVRRALVWRRTARSPQRTYEASVILNAASSSSKKTWTSRSSVSAFSASAASSSLRCRSSLSSFNPASKIVTKAWRSDWSSCANSLTFAMWSRPSRPSSSISLIDCWICACTTASCSCRPISSRVSSTRAASETAMSSRRNSSLSLIN